MDTPTSAGVSKGGFERLLAGVATEMHRAGISEALVDQVHKVIQEQVGAADMVRDWELAEQRAATEHEVMHILDEAPTFADAVPAILEALCRASDWDVGALWMVDQGASKLRCAGIWHRPTVKADEFEKQSLCMTFTAGIGLPGRVWASGSPAAVPNVTEDPNFPRRWAALPAGLYAGLGFPVRHGTEVLGVIELFSRDERPPDERQLAMLSVVGGQIGHLIHRKQAEESLQQSQAHYAAVVAAALDAIVSMDHTGRITEWNPAAERVFGYTQSEALGQLLADLIIPPNLRQQHQKGLTRYLATGQGPLLGRRVEITAVRKGGQEFPVELAITATPAGATPSFTGHLRDISERKRAEAQSKAAEAAEHASRAKDQFLATLSHELRTPLTPVLTTVQMVEQDATLSPEQQDAIRLIRRNVTLETKLIDDLLDLTRISRGKLELNLAPVDLHSAIGHVVAICDSDARSKQLTLALHLDAPHHHVMADATRVQQVLWNLLKNAIKYTPAGGRIELRTAQAGENGIAVSFTDTGEGIEPELLPHIFKAFEQGGAERARQFGGLGLGLAISRGLTDLHGGRLTASSEGKGKGATFALELCYSLAAEKGDHQPHPPATHPQHRQTGRILLVEDNADTSRVLAKLLTRRGYSVRTASSVGSALRVAEAEPFDLVLCDIGLPDGSGLDVIRQLSSRRPVKAIALSGYGMDEDIRRSREAGFLDHLTKPVDLGVLENALDRALAAAPPGG